ncbi:SE1561 family protein [Chryseomicrobium sp. FSL W7-1435]|uniref:SE1561 family protein n=1 Tax=Chryseomicrobium sp. FSL W7-1435 TaxID=2921704 RepID=UPI00315B3581
MGNQVSNQDQQVVYLKERLNMFLEVLDSIEPESTKVEDIDRLIQMMDDLELKLDQFKKTKE